MKRINLALQGGGAHGAFTWGVLDRILEEEDVEIAAISGTSAGALNGAAVKAGMLHGGHEGARAKLDWLWERIGAKDDAFFPHWMKAWLPEPGLISKSMQYSVPFMMVDFMSRVSSPYQWGALYKNPLEDIVSELDFDKVCALDGPELFVCATNVRTGKVRIFSNEQISTKAIMASACLPTLFEAVEIEDPETGRLEAYWDGGYTGNPAMFPMFVPHLPDDIVIININPLERNQVPITPPEIQNRINEISFNSSLLRDLRAIRFVQRLIEDGSVKPGTMKKPRIHMISDDPLMNELSVATKTTPVPSVLAQLKEAGRRAAGLFLAQHKEDLNENQTVDLEGMFGDVIAGK